MVWKRLKVLGRTVHFGVAAIVSMGQTIKFKVDLHDGKINKRKEFKKSSYCPPSGRFSPMIRP